MQGKGEASSVIRILIITACFVVLVAGMRAAASIIVPFLLSVFIAIICTPLLFWLQRKRVPNGLAVSSVLILILAAGLLLVTVVGTSINDFSQALPVYQVRLTEKTAALFTWMKSLGLNVSVPVLSDYFSPGKAMQLAANTLTRLSGMLKNLFFILLTVLFILLEASGFPRKLQAALRDPEKSLSSFRRFGEIVNRYLAIKTLFSLLTGICIWIWLSALDVDFALLWGLVAFLLNYVPSIGSIIAAIPAVLLALIQHGLSYSILTCAGYLVINFVFGSFLEPRLMGHRLGLSTLVVFLSLVFWGWVLGPVGMLLSVPLTMIVKIGLESYEDTRWLSVLLGSSPAVDG